METAEKAAVLARIEFFKGCTQRQVDDIAKLVGERDLEKGDILCRQGERGTDAFVLVDGEAAVLLDGNQIAVVRGGEVVGELSIERGGVRTATLKAITPLRVLVVDTREIESVLSADPKSAKSLGPRKPGDEIYGPERRA
jgi:CRP/FNR family cyclic AMP-dependent transcriptional regulator